MAKVLAILPWLSISVALAQGFDIPLNNWTVPPYTHDASGLTTMADVTPPRAFVGLQPCRIADTRGNGAPIQGGIFASGQTRTWTLTNVCGIPAGADAVSVNFTVTASPSAPPGAILTAWPAGSSQPLFSILNFQAGQTIANAAIVPLGTGGAINVAVSHSTHVILDVNGYFSDVTSQPGTLRIVSSTAIPAVEAENTAAAAFSVGVRGRITATLPVFGSSGVEGVITSTTPDGGTAGVRGINSGTGAAGVGVWGSQNGSGWGVFGETPNGYGVNGHLTGNGSFDGSSAGVRGAALSATTVAPGVLGVNSGSGAGVQGESQNGWGVVGRIRQPNGSAGVSGEFRASGGTLLAFGNLGVGGATPRGVLYGGGLAGSGTKSFLEPHPTDPSKEIRFISLEGNEAGTYFRGRGRFQNGVARIEVPEDFRMVTSSEGLGIQVTPIGQMATVAVASIGLDAIVVRASRDVEFFYTVNGVRRAYHDVPTIVPNDDFRPESPDAPMPLYLSAEERQRLIDNGTYRPDGTVNIETARRLGWDRVWEQREHPTPRPSP